MSLELVDFHCHLDLYPNPETIFMECEKAKVHTLAVTTTPRAWPRNHALAAGSRYIRVALGLHPQLVGERFEEIGLWSSYLSQTRYVGEVGLDAGPRFYRTIDLQKQVFERVLTLCRASNDKIITVHSVRTAKMVLDMIEKHLWPTRCRVVLHWFTGNKSEVKRAVDLGCYFSINIEMLRNERHRNTVATLPLDRILTETDGPFCRIDGRPAHPTDATVAVRLLAQTMAVSPASIAETILENVQRIEASH